MKADFTLDCFGLLCPMPVFRTSEKMKELKRGQILEVIATDDGIRVDLPLWCKATGNELLGIKEAGGEYRAYIRKF